MTKSVYIMTASLTPGDAIGNYTMTLKHLLTELGFEVSLYADYVAPEYAGIARLSSDYAPSGGILWYHYSISAENLTLIDRPVDYRIMDFHGVSPPRLFEGYDDRLAEICRQGIARIPHYRDTFDLAIVHSEFTREELISYGYQNVTKLPLVVDTERFVGQGDDVLSGLLQQLQYILFVGRIVPQKDILGMLKIFGHLHTLNPQAVLILVGGRHLATGYQRRIDRLIKRLGLTQRVLLAGQVNAPARLTSFFRHARFTMITSEWESFCVPVVESMYFDTPVIAHDVPPLPEVMGKAGIVIDKHNPEAAAAAIHASWSDAETYHELQHVCRQRSTAFTEQALRVALTPLVEHIL